MRKTKLVYEAKNGGRRRGRPRKEWEKYVGKIATDGGLYLKTPGSNPGPGENFSLEITIKNK